MKKIMLLLFFFLSLQYARSQRVPDSLRQRIQGKTNLRDIMREVDDYYKDDIKAGQNRAGTGEEEFESEYLQWKRWEYYQASRLDEDGNLIPNVNRKIMDGWTNYTSTHRGIETPLSSYSSWSAFGPTGITRYGAGYNSGFGRVNCIAFTPNLANTNNYMIIGLPQGGIWKTTNNGTSWFPLADNLPSNGVGGLVWDRTNENVIYVLTGDGDASGGGFVSSYGYNIPALGVFKSTDGGVTWAETGTFPGTSGNFYGYKLIQHPTAANTLFAATSDGIYKTTNGGSTWTQEQTGSFTDIEFKPGDPTIMYAAQLTSTAPFWRSTNSGDTWTNAGFTGVPTNSSRIAIGVSANQPNYIYILAGGATAFGSFVGVYRSTTSLTPSFSLRANTPNILGYPIDGSDNKSQATYDLGIEVDPGNANTVLTGGINIWKSTDGGATFPQGVTQWFDDALTVDYVHADIHNLAYNPYNGRVYSVSDGGVGYSTDDGSNWTFISGSLQALATYHGDWYEANQDIIVCGSQDNGTNIRYTASNTYRHINGADGFDNVIKDNNTNVMLFVGNGSIYETTDGGSTKTEYSPATLGNFPQLARDYNTNTRVWAGDGAYLYRGAGFGGAITWTSFAAGLGSRVLTTCPSNSDRIYCSDGSTALRSDNATTTCTFTTISGTSGYPTGVNLTDIEPLPSNSLNIYASFGGYSAGKKVYHSTDGGATWTNFSGTLPNVACHSIAVDAGGTVYVGTDLGVFVRSTLMTDWQPFYNFLPRTPVSELMINNTTGRIYAGTFGRGNFVTSIYSTCPASISVGGTLSGNNFYEASGTVTSTAIVNQGPGNDLALKAGSYVNLTPGAEVANGSVMRAYIAPCNTGGVPLKVTGLQEKINSEFLYVPAKNGVRYPLAKIASLLPGRNGASLEVITEGDYSARITDLNGKVMQVLFKDEHKTVGNSEIKWKPALPAGQYYIQLFSQNELIHFQEFDVK